MLSDLASAIRVAVQLMQVEFTVFGFTVSWWGIFLCLIVVGIILYLIWGLLS